MTNLAVSKLAFALTLTGWVAPGVAQSIDVPEIVIEFPGLIETACSELSGRPLDTIAIDELESRLGEFIDEWESTGPLLLREVVAVTGKPFTFHERVAVLHTCDGLSSMSAPLLISARGYLRTLYPDDPWPVSRFPNFLFHEILHNYLHYSFGSIPQEFGHLPQLVQNHLQLMALEKAVYMRLGKVDAIEFNRKYPYARNPAYSEAAAIVEEKGVEYFIDQLQ